MQIQLNRTECMPLFFQHEACCWKVWTQLYLLWKKHGDSHHGILWNCNADGLCPHSNRRLHCCTRFPLLFRSWGLVLFHCIKECFVKLVTPAVFTITDFKSLIDQILPSCHETYQSSERCRCVIGSVNMDVNTTAAMGFCSVLAELSYNDRRAQCLHSWGVV